MTARRHEYAQESTVVGSIRGSQRSGRKEEREDLHDKNGSRPSLQVVFEPCQGVEIDYGKVRSCFGDRTCDAL